MHLGFFKDFKEADTVLLSASRGEVVALSRQLEAFAGSSAASLPIEATPIPGHPAQLVAIRESEASPKAFCWLCGPAEIRDISSKLNVLGRANPGHQYFDLVGSEAQLMVSVGEYGNLLRRLDGERA